MNIEEVKELLQLVDESDVQYFQWQEDASSLILSKQLQNETRESCSLPEKETTTVKLSQPKKTQTKPAEKVTPPVTKEVVGEVITSPLVGVVYLSSSPEAPPYQKIGSHVSKGDVLCIVEAMKVMNEIPSTVAGEVLEIYVKNEEVVEYGQPLFRIG